MRPLLLLAFLAEFAGSVQAATLIDNTTRGLYNSGIGRALNGTHPYGSSNSLFPLSETGLVAYFGPSDEPDLSTASSALGNWLTAPANPGGTWSSAPMALPAAWARHTETAIIYALEGGVGGLSNVLASFGVDNGLFVWLNGTFLGGYVQPRGAKNGEWNLSLGNLSAGMNYLQLLREDHGVSTDYTISVMGDPMTPAPVPLPASALLLAAGLGGFAALRRRKAA